VLLFTGLRIAELVALDTGDLSISARKGQLTVRRGKGERYRQVPVNSEARTVLDTWLAARRRPARCRRARAVPVTEGPAAIRQGRRPRRPAPNQRTSKLADTAAIRPTA